MDLLEEDSYNVDKWSDIEDLGKLESGFYDLILLDIQGVGLRHSQEEQGVGILKHLRHSVPAQLIIAFSNADFSLEYKEFFDLADDTLAKNADYVDFKRSVDTLLGKRFSVGFYLDRVAKEASPFIQSDAPIRKAAEKAIATGKTKKLEKVLRRSELREESIDRILSIVGMAITIGASIG